MRIAIKNDTGNKVSRLLIFIFVVSHLAIFVSQVLRIADYFATLAALAMSIMFGCYTIKPRYAKIMSIMALSFFGGIGMSYIFGYRNESFFLSFIVLCNALLYFSIISKEQSHLNHDNVSAIFDFLLVVGLVSCVYNIAINYKRMFSLSITGHAYYSATFSSFYGGRNAFAACLFFYVVLCVYRLTTTKKKGRYIAVLTLLLINLFFTFSRSCILATGIAVIGGYYLNSKKSGKRKVAYIICFLGMACFAWFEFNKHIAFLSHYLIRSDYADTNRFSYWLIALKNICTSLMFGYGPGSATQLLSSLGSNSGSSFHNTYIEIMMWGGILLLITYALIVRSIYRALRLIKRFDIAFYNWYIAFLLAFWIYCLFETSMFFALGARGHMTTIILYAVPILYSKGVEVSENEFIDLRNRSSIQCGTVY